MIRFLVDAQLPPALARALTEAGHPSEHVADIGLREAKDAASRDHAFRRGQILVTKDDDFVDRFRRGEGPVLVWMRLGNASTRRLLAWFLPLLPAVIRRIEAGDRLIEVRWGVPTPPRPPPSLPSPCPGRRG